jgi:ribosomal protein L11 methyltransferase
LRLHQAIVTADAATAQRISAAFEEAEPPPLAVGLFETGPGRFEVFAHFAAKPSHSALLELIAAAEAGTAGGSLRIAPIAPADWVTLSQGKRPKVRAGRFLVHGSHDRASVLPSRFRIEIDAGRAFGTAHHATTRGCLLALDDLLKRTRPRRIVDIGTGSGILAIAAALALARRVLAADNDPQAVDVARGNAALNGAHRQVSVLPAAGFAHPRLRVIKADLVFANLLDGILRELAPSLAARIRAGGLAVLSGLTQDQAKGIEAIYRAHGFVLERRILLEGWAVLLLRRRNSRPLRAKRRAGLIAGKL